MKKKILMLFLALSTLSFAKVEIKIIEPLRFDYLNTSQLVSDKLQAMGIIEIKAEEEDFGKLIKFDFPKTGLMTNRKKWVKVEKYHLELPEKEMIITQETEHIKFFDLVDRRDLSKGESADVVEGIYKGYVPIIISEYSKEI